MTEVNRKTTFSWGVVIIIATVAFASGSVFLKVDYLTNEVGELKIAVADIQSILIRRDQIALK